jgi:hypothetical protein
MPAGREAGMEPAAIVGLLAEPARLRVFAALVLGGQTLGEVAATAEVGVPAAARALDRLVSGGLVEVTPGDRRVPPTYRVAEERLKAAARAQAAARPAARPGDEAVAGNQILSTFFADGRLTSIPASRTKRLVVLDHLAGHFEPGRVYPERDVNYILGRLHPDYAALRRYLVDEGLLERRDGFYWRAGGTFEVD